MTDSGETGRPHRRRIGLLAAIVAVAVLLGGTAYAANRFWGTGGGGDPAARSTEPPAPSATTPAPSPTPEPGADITGPLNLLLVGVDTRISKPGWEPHSDAVLILHVTKELDRAYLFALPRDLVVDIPKFPKAKFPGERTKLTHAMSYGSRVPGKNKRPSTSQGFELLSATVSRYTGIKKFDAGAVLTFGGFDNLVDALGGVDLYVDQKVVSQHRRPDGKFRTLRGGGYTGPQMTYEKGRRKLTGWQALDYARQRYTSGGAYTRQRHHQQLIKAIMQKVLSQDLARDQAKLEQVVRSLGDALTFQGRGRDIIEFGYALSRLRPEAMTLVALPGSGVGRGGSYRGEQLTSVGKKFISELRAGRAEAYLKANPKLVIKS
ncbi:LCP family protein [Plantactinospora sp. S1510]|uniref:LCP family protein n=1 Tax=Plantactinospora alkalitolerans TaxID=2789879 RepID=A0ABS0GSR8_9ACTN|nr:LCP family protein [Plantactinospora alkalitolerans]MBF9129136.1 LCP family protein [Plantactinospora alkalitolerans]